MYLRSGPITCCHLCGLLWCLREDGPEWGLIHISIWDYFRLGPNPICFIVYEKTKCWEGPERGGKGTTVQAVYPPESSSAGSLHTCQPDKRRSAFVASPRAAPTGGGPTHPPHGVGFFASQLLRPKRVWVCNKIDAEPLKGRGPALRPRSQESGPH